MIKDKEKFMHENESDWVWNGGLIKMCKLLTSFEWMLSMIW